ncbi:hypothetical protein B5P45_01015 [Phyllobacterium zundukense]|uniref:Uncharacterized protein n=1 Tax=Phyllobacterium zundukense TaxID=1867719 RepID=A0A2N9W3U7_9HYPH|nr:hypothetical protein BLM14_11055 [Phyllobacterium zundukense]PIO46415.1 hypothetical protein B5P45_01015 [Phyllobacterium zundukense]
MHQFKVLLLHCAFVWTRGTATAHEWANGAVLARWTGKMSVASDIEMRSGSKYRNNTPETSLADTACQIS